MTLHYLSDNHNATIMEDVFVVDSGEEYQFSGATLRGSQFVPNPAWWGICFSLGVNQSIGFLPTTLALLVDGQIKAQTKHFWEMTTLHHRPLPRERAKELLRARELYFNKRPKYYIPIVWYETCEFLKEKSGKDSNAAEILSAMEEWEKISRETMYRLVSENVRGKDPREKTEIVVSGTRWLLHNRVENRLVVGELENVWGETHIPKGQGIILIATPVKNGWFMETPDGNKCLLLRRGNSIELRSVCFPFGGWKRYGNWTFWRGASVLLTPMGWTVAIPSRAKVLGASLRWFFFYAYPNLVVVNQAGTIIEEKKPQQLGRKPEIYVGDNSVFIVREGNKHYYLSVADASDWPFHRRLWESAAIPRGIKCEFGVIRGNPDTFVVMLVISPKETFGLWFIDGQGRIGRKPFFVKWRRFRWPGFYLTDLGNGQAIIDVPAYPKSEKIKVKVSDGLVGIDLGDGVDFSIEMVPFSADGKKTLLDILNDTCSIYGLLQDKSDK